MADITDVLTTLATIISGLMYPTGTENPSIIPDVPNISIYPGWPVSGILDKAMQDGDTVHISIYPRPGEERNTTRMNNNWRQLTNNGTTGTSIREVRRQEQVIQITIWAPTPSIRDEISRVIDPELSDIPRILLPDSTYGMLSYRNSLVDDFQQKSTIYRRTLMYNVEYGITKTSTDHNITNVTTNVVIQVTPLTP